MPSALPAGDPMPVDGSLPESALDALAGGSFGIYLHVPFCSTRCGYCDFNTYTAAELGDQPGASRAGYISSAIAELDLAARALGPGVPPVSTIFVGGGTPTLLSARSARRLCPSRRRPLRPGAGRRDHHRIESRVGRCLLAGAAGGTGFQPDLVRYAVRGSTRPSGARSHPLGRSATAGGARGQGGGLHADQPGSHLRDARRIARRLARQSRSRDLGEPGSPERVRPDRRRRHPPGEQDPPRRTTGARR